VTRLSACATNSSRAGPPASSETATASSIRNAYTPPIVVAIGRSRDGLAGACRMQIRCMRTTEQHHRDLRRQEVGVAVPAETIADRQHGRYARPLPLDPRQGIGGCPKPFRDASAKGALVERKIDAFSPCTPGTAGPYAGAQYRHVIVTSALESRSRSTSAAVVTANHSN